MGDDATSSSSSSLTVVRATESLSSLAPNQKACFGPAGKERCSMDPTKVNEEMGGEAG